MDEFWLLHLWSIRIKWIEFDDGQSFEKHLLWVVCRNLHRKMADGIWKIKYLSKDVAYEILLLFVRMMNVIQAELG